VNIAGIVVSGDWNIRSVSQKLDPIKENLDRDKKAKPCGQALRKPEPCCQGRKPKYQYK